MTTNPQLEVLIEASGHTEEDALLILTELNKLGWTIQPMTDEQEQAVWYEWMQEKLGSA